MLRPDPHLSPRTIAVVALVAAMLLCAILVHAYYDRSDLPAARGAAAGARPREPLPKVEPLEILAMTPERAFALNAAVPFVDAPNPPARPFLFKGEAPEAERALTCLASAAWYEAGDDPVGQQAVVQVVLNRLRHPTYPKSVCGVVFQGSERRTGCQFTFTCDGSLVRTPSPAAWARARAVAAAALAGSVFKPVGTATHYHTNRVFPYWSPSLDKIAAVDTHLFFRWRGWWGEPGAFSGRYRGPEVMKPGIVRLAGAIGKPVTTIAIQPLPTDDRVTMSRTTPITLGPAAQASAAADPAKDATPEKTEFVVELDPAGTPGSYAMTALRICSGRPVCTVMGWRDKDNVPRTMPVPLAATHSMSFLYRRNAALDREQVFWNCQQLPREDKTQCLPGTGEVAVASR